MHDVTTHIDGWRLAPGPAANQGPAGAAGLPRIGRLAGRLKRRIRLLLDLAPGQRVLDVGCGPGLDTRVVAECIGPTGRAAGIDYDVSMIREAGAGHKGSGARPWHLVADAARIPYRRGTFDRCYCEQVLQHAPDAAAVLAEMSRVTRPGGVIVVADTDWATLSIDAPEPGVERALVRFAGDTLRNGFAGRQLRRLMTVTGLDEVSVEMWPIVWTDYGTFRATSLPLLDMHRRAVRAGAVSAEALARFDAALAEADRRGVFFASAAVVMARGRTRSHA